MKRLSGAEAASHSASQGIPTPFMEPEGSLLCSHWLATGPYPKPDKFSPHIPNLTTSMEESTSSETASHSASQEIPTHFMDLEGSLPCSQEPATGPYPEPDNPVHAFPPYFHCSILPSTPGLLFRFPYKSFVRISHFCHDI
jgi:hypothetical protein